MRSREPSPSGMTEALTLLTLLVIWVARSVRLVPAFTVMDPRTAPAADEESRNVSVSVAGELGTVNEEETTSDSQVLSSRESTKKSLLYSQDPSCYR